MSETKPLLSAATAVVGLVILIGPIASNGAGRVQEARVPGGQADATDRPTGQEVLALFRDDPEVDVQQIIGGLPEPRELSRRRMEIAELMMERSAIEFIEPPSPAASRGALRGPIEDYLKWSMRRMEDRLEQAGSADERLEVVAQEVAKLRAVEEVYDEIAPAGASPENLMDLEYHRLGVEVRLSRMASPE